MKGITINTFYSADIEKEKEFWKTRNVKFEFLQPIVSRAGWVFPVEETHQKIKGCNYGDYPLRQIAITFNGDVILCCMDWKRENVIGNRRDNTIYELWNSEKYEHIRDMIYGRTIPEEWLLCNKCEKAMK